MYFYSFTFLYLIFTYTYHIFKSVFFVFAFPNTTYLYFSELRRFTVYNHKSLLHCVKFCNL